MIEVLAFIVQTGLGFLLGVGIFFIFREIDLFGRYLQWGRCSLDEAKMIGFDNGVRKARQEFSLWMKEFEEKIFPIAIKDLKDKFNLSLKIIDRQEANPIDLHSGGVVRFLSGEVVTYEMPTLAIAITLEPNQKFVRIYEVTNDPRA